MKIISCIVMFLRTSWLKSFSGGIWRAIVSITCKFKINSSAPSFYSKLKRFLVPRSLVGQVNERPIIFFLIPKTQILIF